MRRIISLAMMLALTLAGFGAVGGVRAQNRAPRMNQRQMQQLLRRIETRSDTFSRSFERQRAALLDRFMRDERLSYQAERDWNNLRCELDQLSVAYSVAWNWNNLPLTPTGIYTAGYDSTTTGTFRLRATQSDDPRVVAENATRRLGYNERQRVGESLVRRLTLPDVMAVERRGFNVSLASTRSPQVNVNADGMEHVESYPNGRAARVRANINGDVLTIVSNGDRANGFTVTINPVDNGRRLLFTRSL